MSNPLAVIIVFRSILDGSLKSVSLVEPAAVPATAIAKAPALDAVITRLQINYTSIEANLNRAGHMLAQRGSQHITAEIAELDARRRREEQELADLHHRNAALMTEEQRLETDEVTLRLSVQELRKRVAAQGWLSGARKQAQQDLDAEIRNHTTVDQQLRRVKFQLQRIAQLKTDIASHNLHLLFLQAQLRYAARIEHEFEKLAEFKDKILSAAYPPIRRQELLHLKIALNFIIKLLTNFQELIQLNTAKDMDAHRKEQRCQELAAMI